MLISTWPTWNMLVETPPFWLGNWIGVWACSCCQVAYHAGVGCLPSGFLSAAVAKCEKGNTDDAQRRTPRQHQENQEFCSNSARTLHGYIVHYLEPHTENINCHCGSDVWRRWRLRWPRTSRWYFDGDLFGAHMFDSPYVRISKQEVAMLSRPGGLKWAIISRSAGVFLKCSQSGTISFLLTQNVTFFWVSARSRSFPDLISSTTGERRDLRSLLSFISTSRREGATVHIQSVDPAPLHIFYLVENVSGGLTPHVVRSACLSSSRMARIFKSRVPLNLAHSDCFGRSIRVPLKRENIPCIFKNLFPEMLAVLLQVACPAILGIFASSCRAPESGEKFRTHAAWYNSIIIVKLLKANHSGC